MPNDVTIDRLAIEVSANAEPAAKSIGDLASAVKKFNAAIAKSKGFGDLVTLANVSKTASDNMQDAPSKLRDLASALSDIANSTKGLKIPSELVNGLNDIGTAVKSISTNVGQRLKSLAAGMSALRDAGEVKISSTIGKGISEINDALAGLNVHNLSRIGGFVDAVRQLEGVNGITISGTIAREIVNIADAAELIGDVDFTPLRDLSNAISHLAVANDIRISSRLAENIVNLSIAAQEVHGTDWTEFERMAEGLRHLEGLGQIRIPRLPRARAAGQGEANDNGIDAGDASITENLDGVGNAAESATNSTQGLNSALANMVQFLQNAREAAGNFIGQFAGGFANGAGISGIIRQVQQIFSSPGNAIGFGLGMAVRFAVTQIGKLASALKNVGIKAFTAGVNTLKTALSAMGSAALAAGKGLVALGKMGARGLASVAKIEFKGIMALPSVFANNLKEKIAGVAKSISGFVRSLGRIAFYRAIRAAIKEVTQALSEGIGNLYQWSLLIDHTFAKSMDKIATSMQYLKNSLGAMVAPIINTLAPAIDFVVDKFVDGINLVNQFLAAITGSDTYTAAKKVATEWAENETEKANKNLKELKKTILGFDELNILNKNTQSDSDSSSKKTPDYASMFETRPVENNISEFARKVREAFQSGEWANLGGMFADKLNGWIDGIDWPELGKKLGDGLNSLVSVYNGFMDGVDWVGLGNSFADGLNSLIETVNWYELGRSLTQHIDALFGVMAGFVEKFDWVKAGKALADAVYGMFDGIDWNQVGTAIGKALTGVGETILSFAENFPWIEVGAKLANGANRLFENIDWVTIADGLLAAFNGALDSLLTFISEFKWTKHGEEFAKGVLKIVKNFPTEKMIDSITGALKGVMDFILPTITNPEFWDGIGSQFKAAVSKLFLQSDQFWATLGKTILSLFKGALRSITKFASEFEWGEAGTKFGNAIFKIVDNFPLNDLGTALQTLMEGAFDFVNNMLGNENSRMFTTFGNKLAAFFNNVFSNKTLFTKAGEAANKLLLGVLSIGDSFVRGFNAKEAGDSIARALDKISWNTIASTTWSLIKEAFKKTGDFVDALLTSDNDPDAHWDPWVKRYVSNSGIGTKIGRRISEAIANINWKQFGTDIGNGANKLFTAIADFFKTIRDDGRLTRAIEDFFSGLPADLPDKIANAAAETFKAIGHAIGKLIWEGVKMMFTPDSVKREMMGITGDSAGSWAGAGVTGTLPGDENPLTFGSLFSDIGSLFSANAEGSSSGGIDTSFITNMFIQPGGIYDSFNQGWSSINAMTKTWMETIQGTISQSIQGMVTLVLQPLNNLTEIGIPGILLRINAAVTTGLNAIQQAVSGEGGMQGLVTLVLQPLNNLADIGVPNKINSIVGTFTSGWGNINSATATAMTLLQTTIMTALSNLSNVGIPTKMSSFSTTITSGWNAINSATATAMTLFQNTILTALTNLASVGFPTKMSSFLTTVSTGWTSINSITATSMTQFQSVIMQAMTNLSGVGIPNTMRSISTTFSNGFYSISAGVATTMTQVQSSVLQALTNIENVLPGRFRNMVNSIISVSNGMIGGVESATNSVVNGLNNALQVHLRFDKPSWAGGGTYTWDFYPNLPHVNFGRVNALAEGGILDGPIMLTPDVLAGEAGREAVLPLESHTEWMDEVAERVLTQSAENGISLATSYDIGDYEYEQNSEQELALLREQNRLLQQLIDKDYNFEITTGQYEKAQRRTNRRAGKMIIATGT